MTNTLDLCALSPAARQAVQAIIEKEFARDPNTAPEPPPMPLTWAEIAQVFGRVQWAWPQWVPRGHVTLLTGPQGVGKSFLAAHLIACFTGGQETWPDGVPVSGDCVGNVLLLETEQMRGAYAERMTAAGAKLGMVYHLDCDPFSVVRLPRDMGVVLEQARLVNARVVLLDSLSGGNDLDENSSEMRQLLRGLAALAAQLDVPVLGVHHLRKRSQLEPDKPNLDRVRGSSAITQFSRSVLALWRPNGGADGPVRVEPLKSSFCKPPEPFGFEITEDGRLRFGEAPEEERPETERERAEAFLRQMLRDGPVAAAKLYEDGRLAGYNERTLRRAKESLGVVTVNRNGKWYWSLPFEEEGEDYPV